MEDFVVIGEDAIRIPNMQTFGFTSAGTALGNVETFKTYLNNINRGGCVDAKAFNPLTPQEKHNLEVTINDHNKNIEKLSNGITFKKDKIDKNRIKIDNYKNILLQINEGVPRGVHGTTGIEIFRLTRFVPASFFLLMLSIFIFLFYVAVTYKGLVMSDGKMADLMINGDFGINVLPQWYEVSLALRSNAMIAVAPFVFFTFGYSIHILLEKKNVYIKYIGIILVLIVTFLLDYLLAVRIHEKMQNAAYIIGKELDNKFEDVLIVLLLGFVVYIIWSIIFHYWNEELEKRNYPNQIDKNIKTLNTDIEKAEDQIHQSNVHIEEHLGQINSIRNRLENVAIPKSNIANSIAQFAIGWFNYLEGAEMNQLLEQCQAAYHAFLSNNKIAVDVK